MGHSGTKLNDMKDEVWAVSAFWFFMDNPDKDECVVQIEGVETGVYERKAVYQWMMDKVFKDWDMLLWVVRQLEMVKASEYSQQWSLMQRAHVDHVRDFVFRMNHLRKLKNNQP